MLTTSPFRRGYSRRMRSVLVAFIGVCSFPCLAFAQTVVPVEAVPPQLQKDKGLQLVLLGNGTFGRPLQFATGGDLLWLIGKTDYEDGVLGSRGVIAGGNLGIGGWQVSAGAFMAGLPALFSVRASYTQTFAHARVSDPKASYLGAQADLTVLYFIRLKFGVDHRIGGTGPEDRKTLYVWSVGVHFWLWDSVKRGD